jgi:hypothetical protein
VNLWGKKGVLRRHSGVEIFDSFDELRSPELNVEAVLCQKGKLALAPDDGRFFSFEKKVIQRGERSIRGESPQVERPGFEN